MRNFLGDVLCKARSCNASTAYLLLALTACYCTIQPLIRQALPLSHDIGFHLFQATHFAGALENGSMLPRWLADSNAGYGSPNFIFYSPLSYYLVAVLNEVTGSIQTSMIAASWFSFFFSGVAMFTAVTKVWGRGGRLFAAILYQVLPFHLLDLYARGTFAELFAFGWFPLVVLCAHGVFAVKRKTGYAVGLSLTYAALILTHLVSGYIFTFVLAGYLLFNYLYSKDMKAFALAVFAVTVGLGLASFYLLPAVLERELVNIEYIVKCYVGKYRRNYLFSTDLVQGMLSFRRMLHLVAVLELVLFLSLIKVLRTEKKNSQDVSQHSFFVVLFLVSLFVTTPLSGPLWHLVPGFATLQFPWRWISMMELSLCFLLGAVLSAGDEHPVVESAPGSTMLLCSLAAICILSLVIIGKSNETHSKQYAGYGVAREYTPKAVKDLDRLMALRQEPIAIGAGAATAEIRQWHPEHRVVEVAASTPALLRIRTSYYPGWRAEIDGGDVPVGIEKETGMMLIGVPPGRHTLALSFVDTPTRRFAKYLSLLSLGTLLLYGGFSLRRRTDL